MQMQTLASQIQVSCGYGALHCAVPMHSTELQQQHIRPEQAWAAKMAMISCKHAAPQQQKHLAALTPEQNTPPQQRDSSPSDQAMDADTDAVPTAEPDRITAAGATQQQQLGAAGSTEQQISPSSTDTQAGCIQQQAGHQAPQDSSDSLQQNLGAQQQEQPLRAGLPVAATAQTLQEAQAALLEPVQQQEQEQDQQQEQEQQQDTEPLQQWQQQQQQQQQLAVQQQQQQQQQHQVTNQRPYDWWRQQAAGRLPQALDPMRLLLLQAHSMLEGRSTCSENILAVLGGDNSDPSTEQDAVAAASNSMQVSQCWQRLQSVCGAKHAARPQQQRQPLQQHAAAAVHLGCHVPQQLTERLLQKGQDSLQQQHQQQHAGAPQQQHGLRFQQIALASRRASHNGGQQTTAAVPAAAADGSGVLDAVDGAAAASAAAAALARLQAREAAAAVLAEAAPSIAAATAAAALPPKPKPPKNPVKKAARPWQPKSEPDFKSWRKEKFSSVATDWAEYERKRNSKQLKPLPDQDTATFAMLVLLHGAGWPNASLWQRWQAEHPKGEVALMVHMKAGVDLATVKHGREAIAKHKLSTQVDARWGDISLVEAQIDSMAEILRRCPHVTHIGLASGHDIPLQLLRPGLLLPGVSMFGMYQFPEKETRCLRVATYEELRDNTGLDEEEIQSWSCALMFHHQWMVLSREHAAALVLLKTDLRTVGRVIHNATNSVKAGMAPDEFIMLTALRAHGYVRSIQRVELKPGMQYGPGTLLNSYPTLVLFPAASSPHPVLWTSPDEKQECQVEHNTGQQYFKKLSLMDCLKISVQRCAIFLRKVDIRQTRGEELARLLSALDMLWHGRSISITTKSKAKRKRQSRSGSKGPVDKLLEEAAAATDNSTPVSSAVNTPPETDGEESETPSKRPRSKSAS